LSMVERLGQIVVSTAIEPIHALLDAAPRRDDQNWHRQARLPQRSNGVQTVAVGQTEIDDNEVVADGGRSGQQLGDGPDSIEPVSSAVERVAQELLEAHT